MNDTLYLETLQSKAHRIEECLERYFLDENDIVYSFIDRETLQPVKEKLFHDAGPEKSVFDFHIEGYTRSEFAGYENCGMCTSSYMRALLYRYEFEKNPLALKKAKRCFKALKVIYNIGKQLEEGFFPKIYGGRFSRQTSTDQVLYAVMAMDHFYKFASLSEKKQIDRMINKMIMFWVKRDYKYTYFHFKNMQWPLVRFPALLLIAYNHSRDHLFLNEYNRLLDEGYTKEPEFADLKMRQEGRIKASDYEKKHNAWLIVEMADRFTMDVMGLDYLLTNDPDNQLAETWKKSVLTMWNEAKVTISPRGKHYVHVLVDMKNGEVRRTPGYQHGDEEYHGAEDGFGTMIARGSVTVAKYYFQDNTIRDIGENIIKSLSVKDFVRYDNPERLCPKDRFKTRFYSGDSIANWLWAYWEGVYRHLW